MITLVKIFVHNQWFFKKTGDAPDAWEAIPAGQTDSTSIDTQVKQWVQETGARITHPGQPSFYKERTEQSDGIVLCVSTGLSVLYEQPDPA